MWENFFSNNIKWWAVVLKFFMSCIWGWLDLRNIAGQTILKSPGEKKSISRIFLRIFSHQNISNSKYSVKLINLINPDFFYSYWPTVTKKAQSNKKFEVTLSSDKLNHCRLFFPSSSWNHHSLLVSLLFASKLPNFSLLWVRIEVSSLFEEFRPKNSWCRS